MFTRTSFQSDDAVPLADFINDLRRNHWTLTSLAFLRKPAIVPLVTPEALIVANERTDCIGIYLLKKDGEIISMLHVSDKYGDGKVAVFSGAETHPRYQRRGMFWRQLFGPCLREMCESDFEYIEAITWTFNRKGIPLYKRIGFRGVPGTSLVMENYLPMILRHPATRAFFAGHDYIRTLQNRRSYGYDSKEFQGMRLFEYHWRAGLDELLVIVDWQRKQIVSIQGSAWAVWCFVVRENPFRIFYRLENKGQGDLPFRIQIRSGYRGESSQQKIPAGQVRTGNIQIDDPQGESTLEARVEIELAGQQVPFVVRRYGQGGKEGAQFAREHVNRKEKAA